MTHGIRFIDPDELLEANRDYIERIEAEGLNAIYDATLDTLFVEIGRPKEALSEHLADNIMLRISPETLKVQGLEIIDFFKDFLPNNRLVCELIQDLELTEGQDSSLTLMEPRFRQIREVIESLIHHPTPTGNN